MHFHALLALALGLASAAAGAPLASCETNIPCPIGSASHTPLHARNVDGSSSGNLDTNSPEISSLLAAAKSIKFAAHAAQKAAAQVNNDSPSSPVPGAGAGADAGLGTSLASHDDFVAAGGASKGEAIAELSMDVQRRGVALDIADVAADETGLGYDMGLGPMLDLPAWRGMDDVVRAKAVLNRLDTIVDEKIIEKEVVEAIAVAEAAAAEQRRLEEEEYQRLEDERRARGDVWKRDTTATLSGPDPAVAAVEVQVQVAWKPLCKQTDEAGEAEVVECDLAALDQIYAARKVATGPVAYPYEIGEDGSLMLATLETGREEVFLIPATAEERAAAVVEKEKERLEQEENAIVADKLQKAFDEYGDGRVVQGPSGKVYYYRKGSEELKQIEQNQEQAQLKQLELEQPEQKQPEQEQTQDPAVDSAAQPAPALEDGNGIKSASNITSINNSTRNSTSGIHTSDSSSIVSATEEKDAIEDTSSADLTSTAPDADAAAADATAEEGFVNPNEGFSEMEALQRAGYFTTGRHLCGMGPGGNHGVRVVPQEAAAAGEDPPPPVFRDYLKQGSGSGRLDVMA